MGGLRCRKFEQVFPAFGQLKSGATTVLAVAENIGKDTVYDPSNHPSLKEIKKQNDCTKNIVFEKVTTDKVEKIINNINTKKATGADGLPTNIIKCSKSIIAPQITSILNMSIDQSVFRIN